MHCSFAASTMISTVVSTEAGNGSPAERSGSQGRFRSGSGFRTERRKASPSGSLSSAVASRKGMATSRRSGSVGTHATEQSINVCQAAQFRTPAPFFAGARPSAEDHHARPDADALVEVHHIVVRHPDAARRDGLADAVRLIRAVNPEEAAREI